MEGRQSLGRPGHVPVELIQSLRRPLPDRPLHELLERLVLGHGALDQHPWLG